MITPATRIGPGNIHGWIADLDAICPVDLSERRDVFSADEWSRAARFAFPLHRNRFLACRLALRQLLGKQLDIAPKDVRLCFGPNGKPAVDSGWHQSDLTFNLSHCKGRALVALARGVQLGVDLEDETREIEIEDVGAKAFSMSERRHLRDLRGSERSRFFFLCWTAREAYLKCIGAGLAVDPDEFSVIGADRNISHVVDRDGAIRTRYKMLGLQVPFPLVGILVTEGAVGDVFLQELSWPSILHDASSHLAKKPTPLLIEREAIAEDQAGRKHAACFS